MYKLNILGRVEIKYQGARDNYNEQKNCSPRSSIFSVQCLFFQNVSFSIFIVNNKIFHVGLPDWRLADHSHQTVRNWKKCKAK